jgi:hypothetical protein
MVYPVQVTRRNKDGAIGSLHSIPSSSRCNCNPLIVAYRVRQTGIKLRPYALTDDLYNPIGLTSRDSATHASNEFGRARRNESYYSDVANLERELNSNRMVTGWR